MKNKQTKPKVALIGGMNNNLFSLLRYLEELGWSCDLFLFSNELDHFKPSFDEWDMETYVGKIQYLPFPDGISLRAFTNAIFRKNILNFDSYDIILGCGYSALYSVLFRFKVDIFFPYGSDLYDATKPRKILSRKSVIGVAKNLVFNFGAYVQRQGLRRSGLCWMLSDAKSYDTVEILRQIKQVKLPTPIVFNRSKVADPQIDDLLKSYVDLAKLRRFKFVVASQARHLWTKHNDRAHHADLKFNNILIKGFADFLRTSSSRKTSSLMLFDYGEDVASSKKYIKELDIEDNVLWVKKMPRKYILYILEHFASVGADQFGAGSLGGSAYEILSCKKSLLTYLDEDQFEENAFKKDIFSGRAGIFNCKSSETLSQHLVDLYSNEHLLFDAGQCAGKFFDKYLGVNAAKEISQRMEKILLLESND